MELSRVTPFTVEFGAGQSSGNLGIVAAVFHALAQSHVNEQVILCNVYISHALWMCGIYCTETRGCKLSSPRDEYNKNAIHLKCM